MVDFPLKKFTVKKEEVKEEPVEEKETYINRLWIPLGEQYAVRFTLWKNNMHIEKFRKDEGKWNPYEEIHLTKRVLTELCPRLSNYVLIMDQLEDEKK